MPDQEPSVPLWMLLTLLGALGTLLTLIGGIVGLVLRTIIKSMREHAKEDVQRAERLAVAENDIKKINAEIGDRKSGIRGWLHELANEITPRSIRRQQEERDK
jgi:hypothetical protein